MKKNLLFAIPLALVFSFSHAQDTTADQEELNKRNWFHQNFQETGIYGVGTDAAINFLNSKGLKPTTIIVGVLDSGIEIDHEDLKKNIWVNQKEKAGNGKDDDKNGFVDDVYGWDFNADASGVDYNDETYEATRIVGMYDKIFASDDKKSNVANMQKRPVEYQQYLKARKYWAEKYFAAKNSLETLEKTKNERLDFFDKLKALTLDKAINDDLLKSLKEKNADNTVLGELETMISRNATLKGQTADEIKTEYLKQIERRLESANVGITAHFNIEFDPTKENRDSTVKGVYGNNEVEGPDAFHGTHVAGIIGAVRNNDIGMNGVAGDVVKLMSVRMVPNGDERDVDVANGIRYAVDNGAKVLNMSFGKAFSPEKEFVAEAIRYADKKGVLMFHAAGNDNKDLDYMTNYPTNFKDNEMIAFTTNWITVGASTRDPQNLKARFSNFGTIKVDIFAPGTEIYSTIQDNTYRYAQGTSMASPVAAGAAALVWAYFPHMTSEQVKEVLFETVNISHDIVKVGTDGDERKFSDLSATGGVIDVYKAAKLAYERYGKK
ncbi:MAG: S8 family serine peptidase [Candidatus Kapabacteria bacterium]|jgi:subtilisin family serine protease|nr:S8 family serine peptidase [Candidatus Kapabacteria bacterium]